MMLNGATPSDSASVFISELYPGIPEGWKGRRLKYLSQVRFSNVDKKSDPDQSEVLLCNYVDAYKNNFITSKLDFMKATASTEEIRKFRLFLNDVLITKDSETPDDIGVPSFIAEKVDNLVCGYHLAILRASRILLGKYLFRYLQSTLTASFFEKRANGITRFAIGMDTVGNCPVIFPALPEQQQIVSFLDSETSRIDALISKKERQIELLQEKRRAIITRAVTKGLDPNAKMKNSGVEWIGKVPEAWSVRRLKYLCSIQTGDKDTVEAEPDGEYPFFVRSQTVERISTFTYDCEAVLTAGDGVGVGKVFHYYNGKFDFHQRVYLLNNFRHVMGKFFFYFLRENFFKVALDGGAKSTVDSLRLHVFQNFWFTLPPIAEQQRIVDFIDRNESNLVDLRSRLETSISLLHEYRSSLITAAVSGQIDVANRMDKARE